MPTNLDNGKLLVSVMDAAGLLSVGRSTIYKLMNSGELSAVKMGHSVRITMASVRAVAGSPAVPAN